LRVANLGRAGRPEIVVVNPRDEAIALGWEGVEPGRMVWHAPPTVGAAATTSATTIVPARGWVWGAFAPAETPLS
jgi:hypothetical protein